MLLQISLISSSEKVLDDVAKTFFKNLPFLLGEHSLSNITAKRYIIINAGDDDGDDIFLQNE